MLPIHIHTIEDKKQRYNTVGDYVEKKDGQHIYVSSMDDWCYKILTTIHEIIESSLCKYRNITDEDIDNFDISFEKKIKEKYMKNRGLILMLLITKSMCLLQKLRN